MEIKNIKFEELESERKKCITFAKDGNTVVKPFRTVYSIWKITNVEEHKSLYIEVVKGKDTYQEDSFLLWDDLKAIYIEIAWIPGYWTLEEFTKKIGKYDYIGLDGFYKKLKDSEDDNYHINKADIETCLLLENIQLAKHYTNYREKRISEREEVDRIRRLEQERKEREEEEVRQKEINGKITDAEDSIRNHETLYNNEIKNTSIVLYLMKKYNVKVPLKTQGWINKALAKIVFKEDGRISYYYYKGSKNSTVFKAYLEELEEKINAA